jgi:hypothetical protein
MSSNPLPVTSRVYFNVGSVKDWYNIIREAHALYGANWRGQQHVKRKLERRPTEPLKVWFDVPDEKFATWVSVKHGVSAAVGPNK